MGTQFSFECLDPKVNKTEKDIKAIAVEGTIKATARTRCQGLAGSDLHDTGVPHKH